MGARAKDCAVLRRSEAVVNVRFCVFGNMASGSKRRKKCPAVMPPGERCLAFI
jgi:hypothetical protein